MEATVLLPIMTINLVNTGKKLLSLQTFNLYPKKCKRHKYGLMRLSLNMISVN